MKTNRAVEYLSPKEQFLDISSLDESTSIFARVECFWERENDEHPKTALEDGWYPQAPSPTQVLSNVASNNGGDMRSVRYTEGIDSHIETSFSLLEEVTNL